MISVASLTKTNEEFSPKVLEMREKIHDNEYLNNAIFRIAVVLSRRLIENEEPKRK